MAINFENGVPFDPGFVQHISAIIPNVQYLYENLEHFRNFGQKRNQFKIVFPKLEELINNYIGFYAGCILWAKYAKTLDSKPLTNNFCFGGEYSEEETLQEVRFLREYLKMLPKDVKYYIGKDYTVADKDLKILDLYEDFLKTNEGFIKAEKTEDLKLPDNLKTTDDIEEIFKKIEETIDSGKLFELKNLIL